MEEASIEKSALNRFIGQLVVILSIVLTTCESASIARQSVSSAVNCQQDEVTLKHNLTLARGADITVQQTYRAIIPNPTLINELASTGDCPTTELLKSKSVLDRLRSAVSW